MGHTSFPYTFTDTLGFEFGEVLFYNYDLLIYYDSLIGTNYIDCKCVRWSVSDDNVIIETYLDKSDVIILLDNIVPGAVESMYNILGKTYYFDSTFQSNNTLRFVPTPNPDKMPLSKLNAMRSEVTGYVKNLSTFDITEDKIGVIIEVKVNS